VAGDNPMMEVALSTFNLDIAKAQIRSIGNRCIDYHSLLIS
jgi:hypothetical protein